MKTIQCSLWIALVPVFLCAGCESRWRHAKVEESEKRGSQIVAAMNRYLADKGRYPARLSALVPVYLPAIKPPMAGDGVWVYNCALDGKRFNLAFEDGKTGPVAYIHQGTSEWFIDTR